MNITTPVVFSVLATFLLTLFALAALMAPPLSADSRDLFVLALAAAGLAFGSLALRRFRAVHRALRLGHSLRA